MRLGELHLSVPSAGSRVRLCPCSVVIGGQHRPGVAWLRSLPQRLARASSLLPGRTSTYHNVLTVVLALSFRCMHLVKDKQILQHCAREKLQTIRPNGPRFHAQSPVPASPQYMQFYCAMMLRALGLVLSLHSSLRSGFLRCAVRIELKDGA